VRFTFFHLQATGAVPIRGVAGMGCRGEHRERSAPKSGRAGPEKFAV
jgi:hypothetical protein